MAERYRPEHDRAVVGGCPDCAALPESHTDDHCDLRPDDVRARIAAYAACDLPGCSTHGVAADNARQSKFYAANPRTDATS